MESAKECVTTHLPNELAPKMDGAAAGHRYHTIDSIKMFRCVGGRRGCVEVSGVSLHGMASSADLGGSSN